jgi:hypothetical protein
MIEKAWTRHQKRKYAGQTVLDIMTAFVEG